MKINTDSLFMVSCTMQDQCLLNKEYRMPTNTYLYLYTMLHYHLANKLCGVCLRTLGWSHLQQDVSMLESTYCRGLSWQWPQHQISRCQLTFAKSQTITSQLTMVSIFSIIQNTLSKISKAISKNYIKTVCTAPRKIWLCSSHDTDNTKVWEDVCWTNLSVH